MVKLKKYSLDGEQLGEVQLHDDLFASNANGQMVKDYITAIRRNLRQWSACTQDRSMVSHSTQKPHKQKGTGRARQGRLSSPHYKGGGVVGGPKPKFDQHVKINKKERRAVVKSLLGEYVAAEKIVVVEDPVMELPKTRRVASFTEKVTAGAKTLFVLESHSESVVVGDAARSRSVSSDKYSIFKKSQSNIPGVAVCQIDNINAFQLLRSDYVVLTQSAAEQLKDL